MIKGGKGIAKMCKMEELTACLNKFRIRVGGVQGNQIPTQQHSMDPGD